ncbi:MAG: S8 family serine peptidase [Bacteroidetes bacterium]|nr:S8 family serine peptidase [Bacteroidota bacterium]
MNYIIQRTNSLELLRLSESHRVLSETNHAIALKAAIQNGWIVKNTFKDGRIVELKELDQNGRPVYYTTCNINAAKTVSTNKLWPGGSLGLSLTGSGMVLREWDGGKVLDTHQELTGRVTQVDIPSGLSDHSTHVAGTMIGTGISAAAKGMANQATLRAFDWNSDFSEMASEAAAGALVSNHSYGYLTGWSYGTVVSTKWTWYGSTGISQTEDYNFGFYSSQAQTVDQIAAGAPYYLVCKAAGNDRTEGPTSQPVSHYVWNGSGWVLSSTVRNLDGNSNGYDCISGFGMSKNVLTVGAVLDLVNGYSSSSDVIMDYFSGTGPADDGRIKPDIVANGDYLYSSVSTSNTTYDIYSGTSMATPNACGSLILLQQYYFSLYSAYMRSATLKGLVIETADEAGANPGPDYMYGWGLLDMAKAAAVIRRKGASSVISEQTLNNGSTYTLNVNATGAEPLKVTICWTDPAGTPPVASLNPSAKMLVNDLDLRVDGTSYPWVLTRSNPSAAATTGDNNTDNVEQVCMAAPSAANHTITVSHKGTLSGGSQTFSIIVTGVYSSVPDPVPFTANATGSAEITLNWTTDAANDNVVIAWSATGVFGMPVNGNSYSAGNTIPGGGTVIFSGSGNSFLHSTLSTSTTYYYRVWSVTQAKNYSCGLNGIATTLCTATNTLPITESFTTSSIPCGWTQQVSGIGNIIDWSVSNSASAGGSSYEMKATCLTSNVGSGYITRVICLPFNSIGMNVVNLSFRHMFDDYAAGATMKVQSSSDGLNWTDETWSFNSGGGNVAATLVNTTITHNLNKPSTLIAFVISGNLYNYDYWYIDNVTIKVPGYWVGGTLGNLTDWNTTTNWGDLLVPTASVDVYIPARTYLPVVANDPPAACNNLVIEKNANIIVNSGKIFTINGNMTLK